MIAKVPSARPAEPDDIAAAAVFLASSHADYINATDLLVDGGVHGVSFTIIE
jgi:NAD(P)-dependent dehydrogenase (short-subunit alcohol dehydrogenase family)